MRAALWRTPWILLLWVGLSGCQAALPDLADLAARPQLDASVLLTGGAFVAQPEPRGTQRMPRTFAGAEDQGEALGMGDLASILGRARVFVGLAVDGAPAALRRSLSSADGRGEGSSGEGLRAAMQRAQAGGHDFLLVVERIRDAAVEDRGINDRWPFTLAAWLFALGWLIPDHSYESLARLQLSLRDAHSGERVMSPLLLEPGAVDLNMLERCNAWGFVQSILVPPFWTSTDAAVITGNVRHHSRTQLMVAAARRLKSVEVREALRTAGPVDLDLRRGPRGLVLSAATRVPLRALSLRRRGDTLPAEQVEGLARRFLASVREVGGNYRYEVLLPELGPQALRVLVQTEAAQIRSATFSLEGR